MKFWYNDATANFHTFRDETAEERATVVSKPTPGPWRHKHEGNDRWVDHPNPTPQCPTRVKTICRMTFDPNTPEATANARLIATAPELVEELDNVTAALETCMAHFGNRMPEADQHARNRLIERARSVLAKAKGEPCE